MIDIACLVVIGIVTWMVAAEGVWGAAQVFLATLLSALIALNFFEPLAVVLGKFIPDQYSDFVALIGLFVALVCAFRFGGEYLAPTYIQVIPAFDSIGKWVVGALAGYATMAFLLTALHTAPLPREFAGFAPERNNFLGTAPDRQLLGFMQYISEKPLSWQFREKAGSQDILVSNAFDGRFERVGSPNKPFTGRDAYGREVPQYIWPSFPIRYAMRRERISMHPGSRPTEAPQVLAPPAAAPANQGRPADSSSGL
jgi:hypothetical protein